MRTKRRVVVTGLGMATALGLDVDETWQKALKGVSGIQGISYPDTEKSPVQAVGAVGEDDWKQIKQKFSQEAKIEGERRTLFALWSAQEAMNNSRILIDKSESSRCGAVIAAGLGINRLEDIHRWTGSDNRFDYVRFGQEHEAVHRESIMRNNSHRPSALIAKRFGLRGYNSTVSTACASSAQAIGIAYRAIKRGDAEMIIAGGADSMINPIGLIYFVLLSAASTSKENPAQLCRPFDRKRSGLVMGEGAGIAVLEEESHAKKRGANIYAEVAGYASTMDAHKVTAPDPKGVGAENAMRIALSDSGLNVDEIDYINAHGTSTKLNDSAETAAIKKVFKENSYNISVSSSKSLIGHLLAASGGPEFIFTVLSVNRDQIHPTLNLSNPDPKCDLDYVPGKMISRTVRAAITNSFGFGGENASIVIKKYNEN